MIELIFPWPPKDLNPNARVHWRVKAKAQKAYRQACQVLTFQAKAKVDWDGPIHAWIDFIPPDRRHRDDDNAYASFKAGRDGMCHALGINDNRIKSHPQLLDGPGGVVKVRLSPRPRLD